MILRLEMANTATRSTTVEIPALEMRAVVQPKTVDADKRTVQIVWTTGARVLRGYYEQFYEELSLEPKHVRMKRLQGGAPLLDSHNSYSTDNVIGVVESAELEPKRGTATIRFDRGVAGEEAFRKVSDGILRNISVGYRIHKMEKVESGEGKIPVYRAVDWEPYELSMVAVGADAGAVTRSETSASSTTNTCEFIEERDMPDPVPATPTTPTTPAAAAPTIAAPVTAPQPIVGDGQERAALLATERDRVLSIQRVGRTLDRPETEVTAAITAGTSLADFRAAAQDAFAAAKTIVVDKRDSQVMLVADDRDQWLRGAENWILQRAAVSGIVEAAARARGKTVDLDPGKFRGMSLLGLARQSLERAGVRTEGMLSQDLVGKAFTHRTGMQTTGDFPVLLENALHKVLLAAYEVTPDTWTRFCSRGTVSDFKPHKRYRLGTFGVLNKVNEAGEFTNKALPDGERQSITADTKGNIIGISRQAIINDDMGAFSQLATELGGAAKMTVEAEVFDLLALAGGLGPVMTDGKTLFHADHGNITTSAALAAAALDLDRVAMGSQRGPSGLRPLSLRPSVLVVSLALGGQARVINDSPQDPDTLANKAQNKANIAGKMFKDIVDTAFMTGNRRYLFADPSVAPVIEVAFLDGQDMPFMEMKEGWRQDGVEWKVRLDFGVAPVDHRGAVTNAGA